MITLSNPDKVLYPATESVGATTKADDFGYYTTIAEVMLPHIAGRPATRKRWPDGVEKPSFFEKDLPKHAPDWLTRGALVHRSGTAHYPIIDRRRPWPGSRSRRRWRSMCRNGVSVPTESPASPIDWCSTSTRARA